MKKVLLLTAGLYLSLALNAQSQNLPGSGNALNFDGVDDHVTINAYAVPTTGDFTVDLWVFNRNNTEGFREFISQGASGDAFYIGTTNLTGIIRLGDTWQNTGILMPLNKWTHLCVVKSATNGFLYMNGILVSSITNYVISAAGTTTLIGRQYGGISEFPNAIIDEVRIWNIALSQTQIRERMCRKIPNNDALFSTLTAYYNFDESTSTTVFDATANNNNGTLINGPARVTSAAPIGNASANNYVTTGLPSTSLSFPAQDNLSIAVNSGTYSGTAGVHLFRVDEQPNTTNGIEGVGNNNRYFGVFTANINSPQITTVYNYTGNPFIATEPTMRLFSRSDNAATVWGITSATQNLTSNTFTLTGDNAEYILGSIGTVIPTISIANKSLAEGNTDTTDMKFTVTLNRPYDSTISVRYKTANISATAGSDYVPINKVLRFSPGQVRKNITIGVLGDITPEPNEQFNVILSNPVNTILGAADTALGIIRNDDAAFASASNGVDDLKNIGVRISPNPAKDILQISGFNTDKNSIVITDLQGRIMLQQSIGRGSTTVNIAHLSAGIYLLTYTNGGAYKSIKILKQ
jgi:hypothetical protein